MIDPDSASRDRPFSAVPQPQANPALDADSAPARRALFDLPEGALGIFFLLVIAAASGGLIAVYWPWQNANETSVTSDRLAALEARVDQIATGHAPKVAAAVFQDERRDLGSLRNRLDADEARLGAIEKATGQADDIDLVALKNSLEKATADVAVLSDRIGRLEQTPSGMRPGPGQIAHAPPDQALALLRGDLNVRTQQLNDALEKIAARTAALEKNAPPADLAERLDAFALKSGEAALESRIGKLEDQDTAGVMRRAAAVLALADLVRASGSAETFGPELDALRALLPSSPEVADLSRYANKGVPTRTMLADRFSQNAATIVAAQRTDQAQGWSERLLANLANLVSIRRVGEIQGHDVEARVARAEVDLRSGDLAHAVAEMNALRGSARAAAGDWLDGARGRLAVDRDARLLATQVVASLATSAAPPPSQGPGPAK